MVKQDRNMHGNVMPTADSAQVRHLFVSGDPELPLLLLLHGTGGDETDLLDVARFVAPDHPILAIRGRVLEKGYARYFERYAAGEFNLDSLHMETLWLIETIQQLARRYQLETGRMIGLGFSNGANIALHAMLSQPTAPLQHLAALHAMSVEKIADPQDLSNKQVFLSYGTQDPLISASNFSALTRNVRQSGAEVTTFQAEQTHALTHDELHALQRWFVKVSSQG